MEENEEEEEDQGTATLEAFPDVLARALIISAQVSLKLNLVMREASTWKNEVSVSIEPKHYRFR